MTDSEIYVILFRGVGGKTQLPVKPLRDALVAAGFTKVSTYINSGNAVLATSLGRDEVVACVGAVCAREFGFAKDIHALTRAQWHDLVENNPFPEATAEGRFLHAAVLGAVPPEENVRNLQAVAQGGDRIAVVGTVAYLHTPDGFGTSKLAEKFDKGIGVPNTARNWNTVARLHEMADEAALP